MWEGTWMRRQGELKSKGLVVVRRRENVVFTVFAGACLASTKVTMEQQGVNLMLSW